MLGKKGQTRMPSSFGGLVQYYSEYKSKIVLKPHVVLILGAVLVAAVLTATTIFG